MRGATWIGARERRLATGLLAVASMLWLLPCSAFAARPTVTGSLRLEHARVRAGERVVAVLVLHNSSARTRILDHGCPHGFIQLTLAKVPRGNGSATAGGFWALPACSFATFVAHPGITRYRLSVAANYGACLMPHGKSLTPMVHCLQPGNRAPPLPAGRYRVAVAAVDKKLQRKLAMVRPVYVRIAR
ncbi:MAG: hypothetical protein KGL16_12590 [Acidobacteriota bacterium]|nr:hypothetical protein [Acidobacteriota bacterium]